MSPSVRLVGDELVEELQGAHKNCLMSGSQGWYRNLRGHAMFFIRYQRNGANCGCCERLVRPKNTFSAIIGVGAAQDSWGMATLTAMPEEGGGESAAIPSWIIIKNKCFNAKTWTPNIINWNLLIRSEAFIISHRNTAKFWSIRWTWNVQADRSLTGVFSSRLRVRS